MVKFNKETFTAYFDSTKGNCEHFKEYEKLVNDLTADNNCRQLNVTKIKQLNSLIKTSKFDESQVILSLLACRVQQFDNYMHCFKALQVLEHLIIKCNNKRTFDFWTAEIRELKSFRLPLNADTVGKLTELLVRYLKRTNCGQQKISLHCPGCDCDQTTATATITADDSDEWFPFDFEPTYRDKNSFDYSYPELERLEYIDHCMNVEDADERLMAFLEIIGYLE